MTYSPPNLYLRPDVLIGPASRNGAFSGVLTTAGLGFGSGAWPTANKAFYLPVYLPAPAIVTMLFWSNSATTNNIDVGLYDAAGTRLVSTGSTVRSGATSVQSVDITDLPVARGTYYVGVAMDGTGSVTRSSTSLELFRMCGVMEQVSAFPLPASATFAQLSVAYVPLAGIALRTLV